MHQLYKNRSEPKSSYSCICTFYPFSFFGGRASFSVFKLRDFGPVVCCLRKSGETSLFMVMTKGIHSVQQNLNDKKEREGWLLFVPLHTEEQISPMTPGMLPKNPDILVNIYTSSMWRSHVCQGFYYAVQNRSTGTQKSLYLRQEVMQQHRWVKSSKSQRKSGVELRTEHQCSIKSHCYKLIFQALIKNNRKIVTLK